MRFALGDEKFNMVVGNFKNSISFFMLTYSRFKHFVKCLSSAHKTLVLLLAFLFIFLESSFSQITCLTFNKSNNGTGDQQTGFSALSPFTT